MPPNFTLKNQDGKNVSLSQFKGKPVVVYFYPADETPGCTKEVDVYIYNYFIFLIFHIILVSDPEIMRVGLAFENTQVASN